MRQEKNLQGKNDLAKKCYPEEHEDADPSVKLVMCKSDLVEKRRRRRRALSKIVDNKESDPVGRPAQPQQPPNRSNKSEADLSKKVDQKPPNQSEQGKNIQEKNRSSPNAPDESTSSPQDPTIPHDPLPPLRAKKYCSKRTPNIETTKADKEEEDPVFCPYGHPLQEAFLPPGLDKLCPKCNDLVFAGNSVLACFTCLPCTKKNAEGNHYTDKMIACCKECCIEQMQRLIGCYNAKIARLQHDLANNDNNDEAKADNKEKKKEKKKAHESEQIKENKANNKQDHKRSS